MLKTCCFTGHRPTELPWGYDSKSPKRKELLKVLEGIVEKAIQEGYDRFITGGAQGIDTDACAVCLKLQQKYTNIKVEVYVPCKDQDAKWSDEAKKRYHAMLEMVDKVVYVSKDAYDSKCMQDRNMAMVNASDMVIGIWNNAITKGGTVATLRYAKKMQKKIRLITVNTKKGGVQ